MSNDTVSPKKVSTIGWVAFGLSVLGFIFACLPGFSFGAWFVTIPAFVVSIIALAKKGGKKWAGVLGLILSIVSGIIAIIVSVTTALVGVGMAIDEADDSMTATSEEVQGGLGQTVSTDNGLDVTVNSVQCGLSSFATDLGEETPMGQFCEVKFALANSGTDTISLFSYNIGGLVGETKVEASSNYGLVGFGADNEMSLELNPGLNTEGFAIIDIAADANLDAVTFSGGLLENEIAIANK